MKHLSLTLALLAALMISCATEAGEGPDRGIDTSEKVVGVKSFGALSAVCGGCGVDEGLVGCSNDKGLGNVPRFVINGTGVSQAVLRSAAVKIRSGQVLEDVQQRIRDGLSCGREVAAECLEDLSNLAGGCE